ncbi:MULTISPECIES: hypothetical protein [unclassified Micromonospora]|uniref:hypothetical protein n=1 Tax=unclassified Micromonospora TaxID=2617518 RepID=UPI0024927245|nr:hypothetical protein [Micromonospora sp. AKA38]
MGSAFVIGGTAAPSAAAEVDLQAGPAAAAVSWDVTGNPGDVVGAWGYGTLTYNSSNGRVEVAATVRDTKKDGYRAILKIQAEYQDNSVRSEEIADTTGSSDTSYGSGWFTFASDVDSIWVQECVASSCASNWYQIW